jgi:hypothetical protein
MWSEMKITPHMQIKKAKKPSRLPVSSDCGSRRGLAISNVLSAVIKQDYFYFHICVSSPSENINKI